jgi:hypothetical protein
LLSTASIAQLREAGTDYPTWVIVRYLQLPETITARTKQLAEDITAGLDNPYDKAEAITRYLRTNLTYSDTIPAPPRNQEPLDWILFDHKEAFCNYYASAEIIMLRSLGIPARLAVGYAEGERTSTEEIEPTLGPGMENIPQEFGATNNIFTVRHRDAHSWPEVYFPGYGWVEFEPTASQTSIVRPLGEDPAQPESETDVNNPLDEQLYNDFESRRDNLLAGENQEFAGGVSQMITEIPIVVWVIVAAFFIVVLVLLIHQIRMKRQSPPIPVQLETSLRRVGIKSPNLLRRWAHYATLTPLTKAYLELNRALSRLGQVPQPNDTPAERASTLIYLLPVAEDSIQILLTEYQADQYSNGQGEIQAARQAGKDIRNRSLIAWFQRIFSRFQEPDDSRVRQPV